MNVANEFWDGKNYSSTSSCSKFQCYTYTSCYEEYPTSLREKRIDKEVTKLQLKVKENTCQTVGYSAPNFLVECGTSYKHVHTVAMPCYRETWEKVVGTINKYYNLPEFPKTVKEKLSQYSLDYKTYTVK